MLGGFKCAVFLALFFVVDIKNSSCYSVNLEGNLKENGNVESRMTNATHFTNPITSEISADPMVLKMGDFYYMVSTVEYVIDRTLSILKSKTLTDFNNSTKSRIYTLPAEFVDLWAPELHLLNGDLYVYFAMAIPGRGHRSYVLKADNASDPLGSWHPYATRLLPGPEETAIDGTVLKYPDGRLFYIWCSTPNLAIAPMNNPQDIGYPRNVLRVPKDTEGLNEGAFVIYRENRAFVIFSTWRSGYCLQMMWIDDYAEKDPLDASNWVDGPRECIFGSNYGLDVVDPGHASFTTSPDGSETWMIYHARHGDSGNWDLGRKARAQKIEWTEDNFPIFPAAAAEGVALQVPSGQHID